MAATVKRVIDDSVITPKLPANEDPVEYPADYFKKSRDIPVYINTTKSLADLRGYVYQGLKAGSLSIVHVNSYLYAALKDVKGKLDRDWITFNIQIGKAGDNVGIFDLVTVKNLEGVCPDGVSDATRTSADDQWLPLYLLGLYRVGRTQMTDYRKKLMDGLIAQCKLINEKFEPLIPEGRDFYDIWGNDGNYTKIVAAVDMFFHMFKKHEKASFRYGTIVSRFKDCAALATFGHVCKITGMSTEEVTTWILNREVADEMVQMMYPGQEIDKSDSYMPYLIDLGLSQKSPYSTVKNPAFHFWGQLTALLLRSTRARNARQPDDIEYTSLTTAGLLYAYAVGSSADLSQQFYVGDDKYISENTTGGLNSNAPPQGRDVVEWLGWFDDNQRKPTADMLQYAKKAVMSLQGLRDKTIGKYAKAEFDK
ncbi:nucleocapsid protein [Cocal virus]|uniref:Nucleoprotein n=1 Tax=Cocal virus TaxID=50713 RepID=B3FRK6_COCAV|nr:nucleocapsid protein [Cocal virus]ACB47434.1 nucleocapsid protein [Cocal virus]